jgi:hypothetical protein
MTGTGTPPAGHSCSPTVDGGGLPRIECFKKQTSESESPQSLHRHRPADNLNPSPMVPVSDSESGPGHYKARRSGSGPCQWLE